MAPRVTIISIFLTTWLFVSCAGQLQYLFTASEYTLRETDGMPDTATVILQRTSETAADTTVETSVSLNFMCPAECPLSANDQEASATDDFALASRTITFAAGVLQMPVSITILNDMLQESREYFCLTVADENVRGSQYFTTVFIPWNDYCIEHFSMADGGTDATSTGYNIRDPATTVNGFVTPWSPTDSETITITVTPQATTLTPAGDGNDIAIFLATGADVTDTGVMYYGIQLDDANADDATHIGGTLGSSYFIKNALDADIGTPDTTTDFIVPDMPNTFTLSYNTGTITLTRTSPAPAATLTVTDADAYTITHLFVSSALDKFAQWEICGIEPRKLPIVSATASGSANSFDANNAIDGAIASLSSCFVSASDANHWLQIDLGKEYNVKEVVIYPISVADAATGIGSPDSLNNARIMVGSCRYDDIVSNHVCSADIGTVSNVGGGMRDPIISVTCAPTTTTFYGRYVYVRPMTDTSPIGLCDIKVYGDEVPLDMETKVVFTSNQTTVAEDVAGGNVVLPLMRTGAGRTCTYVDYYTESSEGDYTQILPNAAVEVKLVGTAVTQTDDVTVAITDDGVCESTESYDVFLTNVVGGMLGTQCYTAFQITDDDASMYLVVPVVNNIVEGMGPLAIRVTRNGDTISQGGSATLAFTDGTATSTDYNNTDQTLTFAASDTEETGSVTLTNDNCYEETETFQVTLERLEPASCSMIGSMVPISITLTDDDSKFHWELATLTLSEGAGSREINIIRTGTTLEKTVEFDVGALGAVLGTDFTITPESRSITFEAGSISKPVTINLLEESAVEGNELFTLTLRDPLATNCPGGNRGDPYILSVTLQDNDATISWEEDDYSVAESAGNRQVCLVRTGDTSTVQIVPTISWEHGGYSLVESSGHTQVCLIRSGVTNTTNIVQTVQIMSIAGTATAETDYQPLTFLTFTSTDKVCAQVQVIGDGEIEEDETFILRISPDQDLTIGNPSDTTITIIDDDANIGFASTSYEVTEGQSLTVQISKTGDIEVAATISSSTGSATQSDFQSIARSITIPAAVSLYSIDIPITDDNIPEADEQFALTLQGSSTGHVVVGATTVTIKDNDGGIVTTPRPATTASPTNEDDGLGLTAIIGIAVASVLAFFAIIMAIVMSYCLCPIFCEKFRAPRRPSPSPRQIFTQPTAQDPSSLFSVNNSFALDYGNTVDLDYGNYNTGFYTGNNRYNNFNGSPLAIQY